MASYINDVVYGANDGIVTTFAVVASVIGAGLEPKVILIVGLASLVADGFSMAVSSYLGSQSERAVANGDPEKRGSDASADPRVTSAATFGAFVVVGFVPLVPYVFAGHLDGLFLYTTLATGAALALVGSMRTLVTGRRAFAAGLEMVALGGSAAALAYLVGRHVAYLTRGFGP